MFQTIIGRVKCAFGRHERWKRYAKVDTDGSYIAPCKYCRIPMRQVPGPSRQWMVDDRPPPPEDRAPRSGRR